MKKPFRVSAAITLLATFSITAAACGGNSSTISTSTSQPTTSAVSPSAAATAQPTKAATVEITVWDKPHADEVTKPFIEQQFAAFEAKYPNIKVTHVEPTKEKEREQFMTAVAGGGQPDAYRSAYPDMVSYVSQGIAADISELWNANPDKANYLPSSLNAATFNNKVYGVPNEMYVTGLLYNKKLFANAKIDPKVALKDWNSFGEAVQKLTDPAKGVYGYAILGMDWADWFFEYYVWQAGGDLTEKQPDGTAKLTFTSDATVKALQYYKDLKFKYKATQKNVVQSFDDNNKDFYTGHAASMVGASDSFRSLLPKGMDINDIGFSPLPIGPSGISPSQVGGNYWILNPKASKEKQQAAFTYASFFTSKEYGEKYLTFLKGNGIFPNLLAVRNDVDIAKYVEGLPADIVSNVRTAAKDTHLEYFLKSRLSPYIVKPIQKILLDESADPLTELKVAQELAQKEVIDKFNAEVKK
jgi:multiple sugar transport system substrate-binding protein